VVNDDCPIPDPPVIDPSAPLAYYWRRPVWQLCTVDELRPMSPESQERHTIFALACMALVARFWNGNKRGQFGEYPQREKQTLPEHKIYDGGRYLGHNITCLAVDGDGEIIDFDFNHNEIFSSSVEHAESRLVRRVFSLAQIWGDRALRSANDPPRPASYGTILSKVTIFTSLESCAQCAGIMALAKVREVVYLQSDPGMYVIGNILRNLTTKDLRAPLPVPASLFGFPYFKALNDAYLAFYKTVTDQSFWKSPDGFVDRSPSITSFLCTDAARAIYDEGARAFAAMTLKYPDHKPASRKEPAATMKENLENMLSNAEALRSAQRFVAYANTVGERGTPHKL
jgi:tRNA(Arg) A34 adenosine deaminase TadA